MRRGRPRRDENAKASSLHALLFGQDAVAPLEDENEAVEGDCAEGAVTLKCGFAA